MYLPTQGGSFSYGVLVSTPDSLIIIFLCCIPVAVTIDPLKMNEITVFEAYMGYCKKILPPFKNHIHPYIPHNMFSIVPYYIQLSLCTLVVMIGH